MNVPVKLGIFTAALATAFAGAFAVGGVTDSGDLVDLAAADESSDDGGHGGHGEDVAEPAPSEPAGPGANPPVIESAALDLPGLAISDRGYTLRLADPTPGAGSDVEVAFTIASPDGGPVLNYRPTHEKEMHLIAVRRDLTGFQHLHPERAEDGTWSVPVDLDDAGTYRVFADFAPSALEETLTLGADLFVPGDFQPAELPAPSTTWSGEDYEVTLAGEPAPGAESELGFTVTRAGTELTDLEPYLGAFGHLVSLRSGDLAYLHTHPEEDAAAGESGGPQIRFATTFPTAGEYRLYLNFAHEGTVRTAEFTVEVPETAAGNAAPAEPSDAAESSSPPDDASEQSSPSDDDEHAGH